MKQFTIYSNYVSSFWFELKILVCNHLFLSLFLLTKLCLQELGTYWGFLSLWEFILRTRKVSANAREGSRRRGQEVTTAAAKGEPPRGPLWHTLSPPLLFPVPLSILLLTSDLVSFHSWSLLVAFALFFHFHSLLSVAFAAFELPEGLIKSASLSGIKRLYGPGYLGQALSPVSSAMGRAVASCGNKHTYLHTRSLPEEGCGCARPRAQNLKL